MDLLTATKDRVDYYLELKSNPKPSLHYKVKRLSVLKEALVGKDMMMDEVFTPKQRKVVEYIFYLTSGVGLAIIGKDDLAKNCEVSTRTVLSAVKSLKQHGDVLLARMLSPTTGRLGIYIFIDKKHKNYEEILREVFKVGIE